MDCNEARALLDADVDRELSAPDALRVQQHVEGCEACRRERARIVTLVQAVRQADYHRAPDALRASILASLPAAADAPVREQARAEPQHERRSKPQPRPRGRRWFSWLTDQGGAARPVSAGMTLGAAQGVWFDDMVMLSGAEDLKDTAVGRAFIGRFASARGRVARRERVGRHGQLNLLRQRLALGGPAKARAEERRPRDEHDHEREALHL